MKSLRSAALDLMADVTLERGYFFHCYSRLKVEILHGIIFIIDGKTSFLCLCRRFSLPVRLRLIK